MKKATIILTCMLACFTLLSGCTDKKDDSQQDMDLSNSIEIDDTNGDIEPTEPAGSDTLPDGFTYSFKDPDNTDGIVVTPRQ